MTYNLIIKVILTVKHLQNVKFTIFFLGGKNVMNSLCFGKHFAKIHPNKIGKNYVSKLNGQGSIAEIAPILFSWMSLKK